MINIGRVIDVEGLKDEIRKLNRTDKTEICRWIDEEAAIGLFLRSECQGIDQKRITSRGETSLRQK